MNESLREFSHRHREGLFSAVSAGFFLILVGMLFVTIPNLLDKTIEFFNDFKVIQVQNLQVYLPAPSKPEAHLTVYSSVEQFSLIWGVFLIAMLAARFVAHSPWRKKAENVSNIVFWFGTAYLVQTLLIQTTEWSPWSPWFPFWAAILMLLGVSLIVRAVFLAAAAFGKSYI